MKTTSPHVSFRCARGMTLVELTVMITVTLGIAVILFIGARAWIRGSDRAGCVLNLRNVQVAVRSYQNVYGYAPGGSPSPEFGTQDIARHLLEKEYIANGLYNAVEGNQSCPGGGTYSAPARDVFPQQGNLYVTCSLVGTAQHGPNSHEDW